MKIALIATMLNEEDNIISFLDSIKKSSKLPDQILIVDGGSTDGTMAKIVAFKKEHKEIADRLEVFIKKGNRSVGRNEAIKRSEADIIACSDIGCTLDKDWLGAITEPFRDPIVDVVGGYYKGVGCSIFQKCLIPYALIMEDKLNPHGFLPATRSVAFRKSIWQKIGGFPEKYSHNEDYVFARRLGKTGAKILFQKDAIVYWRPRKNLKEAFIMFARFAYGDIEAKILRPKVLALFLRYLVGLLLLLIFLFTQSASLLIIIILVILLYIVWASSKNYRYVKDWRAVVTLPVLQITSDFAVMVGSVLGLFTLFRNGIMHA